MSTPFSYQQSPRPARPKRGLSNSACPFWHRVCQKHCDSSRFFGIYCLLNRPASEHLNPVDLSKSDLRAMVEQHSCCARPVWAPQNCKIPSILSMYILPLRSGVVSLIRKSTKHPLFAMKTSIVVGWMPPRPQIPTWQ